METSQQETREVWQRGPVKDVPPLLQPVAHALLQAAEDVERYTAGLTTAQLWGRPAGVASVAFHLMHIAGVIDRLFTYARGEALSQEQLRDLAVEKEMPEGSVQATDLIANVHRKVGNAVHQLENTLESSLTEHRELGRKKIPTTVLGLLFHAAEHVQRHIGQLLVTSRIVRENGKDAASISE